MTDNEALYRSLEGTFMEAVRVNGTGDRDKAMELFRAVLTKEPRMPEPRLEVALILLAKGELEEAEAQAEEAMTHLENGWRWLEDLTDQQLMAHACNLMVEILKARSVSEKALARSGPAGSELWQKAYALIKKAVELDPENPEILANYYGLRRSRVSGRFPT